MTKTHPADTLRIIFKSEKNERPIASFLKANPSLVYWTFCVTGGHKNYVFSEFTVGNQYKADLVVLHSYSGTFEAHFIELEPIDDKLFNKDRTPSKRLRKATLQIDDWRDYIKRNDFSLRQDLVRWAKTKDLLNPPNPNFDPSNYAGELLIDPSTNIYYQFYIIIGMRKNLTKEKRELKNRYKKYHDIDIGSYERFLDAAERKYIEMIASYYTKSLPTISFFDFVFFYHLETKRNCGVYVGLLPKQRIVTLNSFQGLITYSFH